MNKARNKKMARYIERQNLIRQFDKIIKNRIKIFKLFETDDDIRKCHSNLFTEVNN
jgi:transposase-like protein